MIDKLSGHAIRGIQRGLDGLRRNANEIAAQPLTAGRGTTDTARAMVQLQQQERTVAVNAKTLEAADEALGTLLDVRA